jgi:hypothetical protein
MTREELLIEIKDLIIEYEDTTSDFVGCGILFDVDECWCVFNGEKFEEVKDEK